MADESNSTPSPAPDTDLLVAMVARWHEINAALAATGDPAEQDRLASELRDVERRIATTRATTLVGALAGLELLLVHDVGAQPMKGADHETALHLALIESAAGILAGIIAPAYNRLLLDLKEARRMFKEAPEDERIGAMLSLVAYDRFFRALSVPMEYLAPSFALLSALEDARNGKPNPMLANKKLSGGLPDERRAVMVKVTAAMAMDLMIDAGLSKDAAARYVYNEMVHWGIEKRIKFSVKTIKGWRETCSEWKSEDPLLSETYHGLLKWTKSIPGDPKTKADGLLKNPPLYYGAEESRATPLPNRFRSD